MMTRRVTILLLVCACPCGLVRGEVGWRFRQEYVVWPGPYWRGPDQPPVAANPDDPCTWGMLTLEEPNTDDAAAAIRPLPPAPLTATPELTAPLVETRPIIDGVLGWDEWSGAAQAIEPLDAGEVWAILAQHDADTLYVCLIAPFLPGVREGQVAEVYLAPEDVASAPLNPAVRQFRLRPGVRQSFLGEQGRWISERVSEDDPTAWRGAVSGNGDGAWAFPVYEFAIPWTAGLPARDCPDDLRAGKPAVREQFRLMARLQTLGHGDLVGAARNPDPEAITWPDNRTSHQTGTRLPVVARPDYWQPVSLRSSDLDDGLCVPATTRAMKIDGQIGIKEWADAHVADYNLPGDQWRRVYLARDGEHLYVAVRLHLARGMRRKETCRLYIDPCGDGGLLPRGDDVQYRVPLGTDCVTETFRYEKQAWRFCAYNEIQGASYPVSSYESTYELAVPLGALGPDLRPNVALEVTYGLGPGE